MSDSIIELPATEDELWDVFGEENHKVGGFRLPRSMILKSPAVVAAIMKQCVIVRAELILISDVVDYTAFSSSFNWTKIDAAPPFYEWLITTYRENDEGPIIKYSAEPKLYVPEEESSDD